MKVARLGTRVVCVAMVFALATRFVAADATREMVNISTPEAERRPTDNTFLTFTEWYLVYSPRELAAASGPPSSLPFFEHIAETWRGYWHSARAIPRGTPTHWGYHAMILVIATSTTVEYAVRGIYERTLGRLTELVSGTDTCEDAHAIETARSYAAFLDQEPWYKFNFWNPLRRLWSDCSVMDSHPLRAIERRYALSVEYAFKGVYAWMIGGGTQASYDPALPTTFVYLRSRDVRCAVASAPESCFELRSVARYQAFTDFARQASPNYDFVEIAGNRGPILVSVLAAPHASWPNWARVLFTQKSADQRLRYAIVVDVARAAELLRWIDTHTRGNGRVIEHIYDY